MQIMQRQHQGWSTLSHRITMMIRAKFQATYFPTGTVEFNVGPVNDLDLCRKY
jgi:hypothetical protein